MSDPKLQLEQALKDFDARHDEYLRRLSLLIGRVQRWVGGNPLGRFVLRRFSTRTAAWAVVRFGLLGIAKPKSGSAVDIAYEWQKLAVFFRVPVEIESASPERVVLIHPICTVGFNPGEDKICAASMNLDHEIVRRLGGRLTTTETLASGGRRCRHIVEPVNRREGEIS